MIYNVFLSLGSNIGDRENYLSEAVSKISHVGRTMVKKVSDIYETEPVGYTEQGKFLNIAVYVETSLEPEALLKELQNIENQLKRVREITWGPRTIDIDILLYNELKVDDPDLIIPHPRMFERAFVLVPLKDIYPSGEIFGRSIHQMVTQSMDNGGVKFYKKGSDSFICS